MDMFRPRERMPYQLDVLARLARGAPGYELVYDDLEAGAAAIFAVMERL
jgi:hypothetical protein